MVQMEDNVYEKLKKDADDNKQLVSITRIIVIGIIFCILFFTWGRDLMAISVQKKQAELQNQIAIEQAETNKRVMAIESEGMTNEEYFEWLTARK